MSVYIVTAEGSELAKLGFAKNPKARFNYLKTGSPLRLRLAAVIPADRQNESELHTHFAAHRQHGEWFSITPSLQALINQFAIGKGLPTHRRPRATNDAAKFIDSLGGTTRVATALGIPAQTVSSWKRSGKIPQWRKDALAELSEDARSYLASTERFGEAA